MKTNLNGVGVALITPFDDQNKIDLKSLESLIEHVITGGVDYLVAFGTTAETPTISDAEKAGALRAIIDINSGRLPIVVGIGGNNTADIVNKVENFDFTGISTLLSVTPYYNKPTQEGLYQHYKAICKASPIPVMLYNVPGRTGVNMSCATTLRIAKDCPNAIALKEANGNIAQTGYLLRDRPEGFSVLSGDDNMTLPMMSLGAEGVISVAANAFPKSFKKMVELAQVGDYKHAAAYHLNMIEAVDALFEEGNPTGIKAALAIKGIIKNNLRLPLVPASETLYNRIKTLIEKYNLE